jgi:hypothetical protein
VKVTDAPPVDGSLPACIVPPWARTRSRARRSSQPGSHQLRAPSTSIVAGTSTIRTTVASTRITVARPRPAGLRNTASLSTKAPNR